MAEQQQQQQEAVVFSLWGVVVPSRPGHVLQQLEDSHRLPRGFLTTVASQDGGAMRGAEHGAITLSQMIPAFQAECVTAAQARGVTLPSDWSIHGLLGELDRSMGAVPANLLATAAALRRRGVLTAVLANHWVDDRADGEAWPRLLTVLGFHFDLVLQSCHVGRRLPQEDMFTVALKQLGVAPQRGVWLGEDEEGVGVAQSLGMKALLVTDVDSALVQLMDVIGRGRQLATPPPPLAVSSQQLSHGYVSIRSGVRTHYVECGLGPPVVLCHGFPESWFSWRYQLVALAAAGFRVLALDMKGFAESTAPPDIEEYSQEQICKDLVTFLDKMALPKVTLVGHDWGGATVWSMAQCYPERVRAVGSLNTPWFKSDPDVPPSQRIQENSVFDYQVYFNTTGVAEAELEKDLERTFKLLFTRGVETGTEGHPEIITSGVCARGGLFVGLPDDVSRSSMLTEDELQFYVKQYKQHGFRRPLNWYRNHVANWKWTCSRPCEKLLMPALMVTAGKDAILTPSLTKGMEKLIANLTFGHIEDSGHWTQMDKPAETNAVLISWLKKVHAH